MILETMKPGRELDARVEEVLWDHKVTWESLGLPGAKEPFWSNGGTPCPVRFYSTDIAAAWEVVTKLGPVFSLHLVGTEWECCFEPRKNEESYGRSDSASHAICLAALKAVEH